MAGAIAALLPEVPGVVVAPGPAAHAARRRGRVGAIRILHGEHPVPGPGSFSATQRILAEIRRLPADATILFLLSGGASALLAAPAAGLTRTDKQVLNEHLLRAGASIDVMNAVRKHVSAVKGGRLALLAAPREIVTLALSDVPGNALATVGSGPAVADPSTFASALRRLRAATPDASAVPANVWRVLAEGARGMCEETPKPGDRRLANSRAVLIGTNRTALIGAGRAARALGYEVLPRRLRLAGEAAPFGRQLAACLPEPGGRALCVLGGGETWVRVGAAAGKGGRSQELALAAASGLSGSSWSLLCAGTDGVDGRTDAAGAFCDGQTLTRGGRRQAAQALERHDAYSFFSSIGGLFRPGPTGTNVMDIAIALHPAAAAN